MRIVTALLACGIISAASPILADSRVFIIVNQSDGYGIDQCLARGDRCGAHAAQSYCRSRDFADATAYHRVESDDVTGSVSTAGAACEHGVCREYIAITCER